MILPNVCFPLWKSPNNLKILDRDLRVNAQNINLSIPQSFVALRSSLILLLVLSHWPCEACGWLSIRPRVRKCYFLTEKWVQQHNSENMKSLQSQWDLPYSWKRNCKANWQVTKVPSVPLITVRLDLFFSFFPIFYFFKFFFLLF